MNKIEINQNGNSKGFKFTFTLGRSPERQKNCLFIL